MRNVFGWSYPPGAAGDPNAPYNQTEDTPCEVCGNQIDDCICPECQVCGEIGNPGCYAADPALPPLDKWHPDNPDHGLVRSLGQVVLAADWLRRIRAADAEYCDSLAAELAAEKQLADEEDEHAR